MSSLSTRLTQLMAAREITQAAIAEAAKVSRPSVADWISGKSQTIKAEPALRIAHSFQVNPWWLVFGDGPMQASNPHAPARPVEPSQDHSPRSALELVEHLAQLLEAVPPAQRREAVELTTRLAMSPDSRMARADLAALLQPYDASVTWRGVAVALIDAAARLGKVLPQDELIATIDLNFSNALRTPETAPAQPVRYAP